MRWVVMAILLTTLPLVGTIASLDSPVQADPGFEFPWSAGVTYQVLQAPGGPTHVCPGYNCYAYDFGLSVGTPVKASAGGIVLVSERSNSDGGCDPSYADKANYIYILHGDGSKTLYLHLKDVVVSGGEEVMQGDVIGHSGQTGYACSAHLHFQRDVDGTSAPVDFDEHPGQPLDPGQLATSQNSPPRCQASTLADDLLDAWPADFSSDQKVDGREVFPLAQRFGSTSTFTPDGKLPYDSRYDLNGDQAIDGHDLFSLALHFNRSCP